MGVEKFFRADVLDMAGYKAEAMDVPVKLDANESPYDLPEEIKEEAFECLKSIAFNRYPDPEAEELRGELARELAVDKDCIVVGNGSDELMFYILLALACKRVVSLVPSFVMYHIISKICMKEVIGIPLHEGFGFPRDEVLERLDDETLLFIGYPNNPTGNCFNEDDIIKVLEAGKGLIIIDEAYFEFSGRTFLPYLDEFENMVILRTFSKALGLAGARVGYMIARPEFAAQIMKIKLPYNVNTLSQAVALTALRAKEKYAEFVKGIVEERKRLYNALKEMEGLEVYPSDANFLLVRVRDGEGVWRRLLDKGVRVRKFSDEVLRNFLRITVGKPDENEALICALREIVR